MNDIITILTSEDKEDIRASIKSMMMEQIRIDFENNDNYLLDPRHIEEMVEEVVEELKEEVKDAYRKIIMNDVEKKLKVLLSK